MASKKWTEMSLSDLVDRLSESEKVGYEPDTFHELMRLITEHDNIMREWIKFIVAIGGAILAALWAVVSFGELRPILKLILIWLIAVVGVAVVIFLTRIVSRVRRWQRWFIQRAQELQLDPAIVTGTHIYPIQKPQPPNWLGNKLKRRVLVFFSSKEDVEQAEEEWSRASAQTQNTGRSLEDDILPSGIGPTSENVIWLNAIFCAALLLGALGLSLFYEKTKSPTVISFDTNLLSTLLPLQISTDHRLTNLPVTVQLGSNLLGARSELQLVLASNAFQPVLKVELRVNTNAPAAAPK